MREVDPRWPHVVIVGAGFGGLYAARTLAHQPVRVTLVDRSNHHTFQPLLYQVATAALSPGDIATPIRRIVRGYKNVDVILGEVEGFDLDRRVIKLKTQDKAAGAGEVEGAPADHAHTPDDRISYDYLIVAAGATHAYFGHDEWEFAAPGLKTLENAVEIRRRVLLAFELAERSQAMGEEPRPLNFFVVGGGPTGVELAGALAEIATHAIEQDFRQIDTRTARIVLVEGQSRILSAYPEDLSRSAKRQLEKIGVEVRCGVRVTHIEPGKLCIGDQSEPAAVILWAAGVAASPLGARLSEATGAALDRSGRIQVQPDLTLPGHPEIFVVGDLALMTGTDGRPLPGVAQVAIQMGRRSAKNILQTLRKQPRKTFAYWDKGSLATIGRAAAVGNLGKRLHISGTIAWLAWLFIHLFFLIGFRNRVLVILQWAWAYVTYDRGARLITGSNELPGWREGRKKAPVNQPVMDSPAGLRPK